jgi:hypothetical protein
MEGGCSVGQAERGDGDEQRITLLAIGACRLECGNAAHESIVDMLAATHLRYRTALAVSAQLGKLKEKSKETWTKFSLYDTSASLKRHAPSTELPPLRIRPGSGLGTGPRFCHCFLLCSGQTHTMNTSLHLCPTALFLCSSTTLSNIRHCILIAQSNVQCIVVRRTRAYGRVQNAMIFTGQIDYLLHPPTRRTLPFT